MWVRGKRKCFNIPSNVQLNARPVQLEGGFVLPLHKQNHVREAQLSASSTRRGWDFWKGGTPTGGGFPAVSPLP